MRTLLSLPRCIVAAVLVLVLLSLPQYGQEFRATVTGRVLDASNATVPNATVRVKNLETNEVTDAVTDPQGAYTALFLRPGRYSLSVQVQGFKNYLRDNVVLNVGQTATININLELGTLAEQVTVTTEAPLLDAAKADRGAVIENERVTELPLNGRNPFMLSMLVSGVSYNGELVYQRPFDNGAIARWSINGSRNSTNEFLLDGAPNNAEAGNNNIAYVPPVDAVQEFKIQTNSYDSQYGHTGGGIVNVSLKSGTNALHGTVYEFARRNAWDANSFQNNAFEAPKEGHYLDQYGFQLEGPVVLPRLYNGRDKTFFMTSFEGYREGTPYPLILSVPEPEMRTGDFSELVTGDGVPMTIYDPKTGRDVGGKWVRDPFPGNVIPADRINPIARKVVAYLPQPNTATPGLDYSQNNFFMPGGKNIDADGFYNFVGKIDQNIGDKHRMYFRHANNWRHENVTENGLQRVPGHRGWYPHKRINYSEVADWVMNLSPTLILNNRLSFSYYREKNEMEGNAGFDNKTLGFPASLVDNLPHGPFFGVYSFSGYASLGRYPQVFGTNSFAYHPNFTKVRGSHMVKGGVDMRWVQWVNQNWGNPLSFSADSGFTQKDYSRADGISGNSIASWLLGAPSGGSSDNNLFPFYSYRYYAPWVQDDWKVTRKLTINLGLRWDVNMPPVERYDRMNRSFDLERTNSIDKLIDRTKFPTAGVMKGGLLFAGADGTPRAAADLYKKTLQPRLGFALQLTNKIVMRGGWGRYYLNPSNSYIQSYGFSQTTTAVTTLDGGRTPVPDLLNNPFPDGLIQPPGASRGDLTYLGRGFNFVNPSFRLPHVNQFSYGFQVELPWRSRVDISYVGSRSKNLENTLSVNTYDLALRQKCNLMEGGNPLYCDERLPNPFQGIEPFRGTTSFSAPTLARSALAVPYPHFGGLTQVMRNDASVWYNSMQLIYEMRNRGGMNLTVSYTLSKMIEEAGFNDVQRRVMQRGLYQWDRPHHLVVSTVYQLPFGPGQRWANSTNRVLSRLLGGWETTVIFQYQSGLPWALPSNVLYVSEAKASKIDWSASRVYGVTPCVARWNDNGTITMQSFSKNCSGYNFLITPRFAPRFTPNRDSRLRLHTAPQADISLNKSTRITENTRLQFRAEAFNAFNTYMFYNGAFNNNPQSANFGSVEKAAVGFEQTNRPRYIQLAVKFLW